MVASRAYYLKYVTSKAKACGLVPFYWDNGSTGSGESDADQFGLFDRSNGMKVIDAAGLGAIRQGAATAYPY